MNENESLAEQSQYTSLIELAIQNKDIDVGKLEKLLEMQERWQKEQARKAYIEAMAEFRKDCPKIFKDRKGHNNTYASLAQITLTISEALSQHGLNVSWEIEQNGQVSVTCNITHIQGHTQSFTMTAPIDDNKSMNPIQRIASTISYLERYTLLAAIGMATHEMDDDGQSACKREQKQNGTSPARESMKRSAIPPRPWNANYLKERLHNNVNALIQKDINNKKLLTESDRSGVMAMLQAFITGGTKEEKETKRHALLGYLFDFDSTKSLNYAHRQELNNWIQFDYGQYKKGEWGPAPEVRVEAELIWKECEIS